MKKIFCSMLMLMLICSTAFAAPRIEVLVEDGVELFNPSLLDRLNDHLLVHLIDSFDVIDTQIDRTPETLEPEYRIEVRVLSMGLGKMVNNGLATTISTAGTISSIFVSPLSGSLVGSLGWFHSTKPVFAISARVRVIRLSDGEIVYAENRLGRSNIQKKDERPPQQVIEDAIEDAASTIARPLIKDAARSRKKFFGEQ